MNIVQLHQKAWQICIHLFKSIFFNVTGVIYQFQLLYVFHSKTLYYYYYVLTIITTFYYYYYYLGILYKSNIFSKNEMYNSNICLAFSFNRYRNFLLFELGWWTKPSYIEYVLLVSDKYSKPGSITRYFYRINLRQVSTACSGVHWVSYCTQQVLSRALFLSASHPPPATWWWGWHQGESPW